MKVVEHSYEPHESQAAFHSGKQKYKGFKGAKGSGKTRALIEECVALCWEFPGNVGVVGRKDYTELARTTMQYFLDWMPQDLRIDFKSMSRKLTVRSKDPEKPSTVYFVQEKEPKEFESLELGFFALDEADECPFDTFKTLQSRLRLKNTAHYGLLAFNPTNRLHWIFKFFVQDVGEKPELSEQRLLVTNNTMENLANLPSNYVDSLKEIYVGDELKRFLYGEWGSISNEWSVWQNWNSTTHVAKEPIKPVPGLPGIRAWDYGMRAGALSAQLYDGQLRVLHPEVCEFNKGVREFAPIALSRFSSELPGMEFLVDLTDPPVLTSRGYVTAKETPKSEMLKNGVRLTSGTNDWTTRNRAMNYFLTRIQGGQPCLLVDPRCEILIAGFEGGYRYRESASERGAKDVVKNEFSELHDCLQHIAVYAHKAVRKNMTFKTNAQRDYYSFGYAGEF